jgi:malonyl-CoA/methylmalonyl-CoA synthetase
MDIASQIIQMGHTAKNEEAGKQKSGLCLIDRAWEHGTRTALVTEAGQFSYADLLDASARVARFCLAGRDDLNEQRVAFLAPSGFDYVAMQWGIWRAGGVAVPLCTLYPEPELRYVIENSKASILLAHEDLARRVSSIAEDLGIRFAVGSEAFKHDTSELPRVAITRRAMMLYTSGTTGKPKGVVTTHLNNQAQIMSLVDAWGWSKDDHILHVLPLHHIHGIVNVLLCSLWSGATCEMMSRFDPKRVWEIIERGGLTLFMAVPTIYSKLITAWEAYNDPKRGQLTRMCSRLRLMVSGSAALPVPTLETWETISGHRLLERYGMTEIGMALSNPLNGERVAGTVGTTLPGIEVRLVGEAGHIVAEGEPGEIEVCGPNVFLEYWDRPEATREAFKGGWFKTGDIAVFENGRYRLLGRNSVDIIKTGGYKVSALEIESVLKEHASNLECAVVGVEDQEWGQQVCAAMVPRNQEELTLDSLRTWAKGRMAVYKVPQRLAIVDELPRNAMGKVVKQKVVELFEEA